MPQSTLWQVMKGPNIQECTERQWAWHQSMPNSRWLEVKDNDKIVGAANWIIYEKNPFEEPQPMLSAYWYPEGPIRTISNHILQAFFANRPLVMNRPHFLMNVCFVSKEHRRKGIGSLLVDWGCKLADEMGLEAFVESSNSGKGLYEAHGFVAVRPVFLDLPPAEDGQEEEWARLKKLFAPKPFRTWLMWRPKGGKFEEGKTVYSWEK